MAVLIGGESGELGITCGELGEDFFFIGPCHHDVVEMAVELVKHMSLIGAGGGRGSWLG